MSLDGKIIVLGGEPAALSCIARLLQEGIEVTHIYPVPWGTLGASRDVGLAYPELGEPYQRLLQGLGEQAAGELHLWGKMGVDLLSENSKDIASFRRGSRLVVMRDEREAKLVGDDALFRAKVGDELRLMSGAAASNYAPLATEVHMASFETHCAAFAPVALSEALVAAFRNNPSYRAIELSTTEGWPRCCLSCTGQGVRVEWQVWNDSGGSNRVEAIADVAVIAAGVYSSMLLGGLEKVIVPILGQAFCSAPLREKARSSVVGLTASWGYERYRFDPDQRLLGCGIDPNRADGKAGPVVDKEVQRALWARACSIFSDLAISDTSQVVQWGVLFCATCDGLPLLGPLMGEPRIHIAAGFSTSSWSLGYKAGDALARSILGGKAGPLIAKCSPRRFL